MKLKDLKNKLWFNLFIRITVIFFCFVLILALSNVTFLRSFFTKKQKSNLKEQLIVVSQLDFNDFDKVRDTISDINEEFSFDVEIYKSDGEIIYTTHGRQMLGFFEGKDEPPNMRHEKTRVRHSENLGDGIVFEKAIRSFDNEEFLLCRKEIAENIFAEIRIQTQMINNSAAVANEFILIVALICFVISMLWVYLFAKKFSKPISQMNEITKDMSRLDFKQRLEIKSSDEIGQLAGSINGLSDSLSHALWELETANAKLKDEIELERSLDSMRKTFVANVSHELKTPISIISGYAEGLKLDINPESKQTYCDTILEESQRMNKLVLSILELSRYESGQIPLNFENFNIHELSDALLERIFKGSNIKLQNNIPENTICYCDSLQAEQVLTVFFENAKSHTEENGSVTLDLEEKEKVYKISVTNTGRHIPQEDMSQIWQSFYRGDTSHKRESNRFGLGLSIVAAIVKMLNTRCGVYNTENGVCFWFEVEKEKE